MKKCGEFKSKGRPSQRSKSPGSDLNNCEDQKNNCEDQKINCEDQENKCEDQESNCEDHYQTEPHPPNLTQKVLEDRHIANPAYI